MEYFILNDLGELQYASNHEPKEGVLFTDKNPNVFVKPLFDFELNEWIEGITPSQIEDLKPPIYEQKIIESYIYLMNRALSSSMGKYGTYEYLQIQKQEYDKKYFVAKGIKSIPSIEAAILKEMERDFTIPILDAILTAYGYNDLSGSQIEKMYVLIVIRYEYAESRLEVFEGMAIDFRTKSRTFVENKQWSKLETAFALIENLPNELTDLDIENYYSQFDNL
jgi:hypothetical protein